jgi:hypothetical protein
MFRYLMDNAIASKQRLNLSVGVTLSAAQREKTKGVGVNKF